MIEKRKIIERQREMRKKKRKRKNILKFKKTI
jgi:hypothetical protein